MINKNLGKKGVEAASYLVFALVLCLIGVVFAIVLFFQDFTFKGIQTELRLEVAEANYELLLMDILRVPIGDKTMADLIVTGHANNDYGAVEKELNTIMKTYLGANIDWEFFIDGEKKKDSCGFFGCKGEKHSFNTVLPLFYSQSKPDVVVMLNVYVSQK